MFGSRDAASQWTIKIKNASGAGNEEVLFSGRGSRLNDWSRDGRYAVYSVPGANGIPDLWLLPLFDDASRAQPVPFVTTDAADYQAKISPDGRWIAYSSGETGRMKFTSRDSRPKEASSKFLLPVEVNPLAG